MIHTKFLVAVTVLGSFAPAQAQYDEQAPEPAGPIRGDLVIGGGGARARMDARADFARLARGEDARVLILAGTPASAEDPFWKSVRRLASTRLVITSEEHVPAAGLIDQSTGVWIESDTRTELLLTREIADALAALIARGGVVGSSGEAAASLGLGGFNLLDGAVIETGFEPNSNAALLAAIQDRGTCVGLGIPRAAVLNVRGRRVSYAGAEGAAHAYLAPGESRPPRHVEITRSRPADWIALARAAQARAAVPFPAEEPPAPHVEHGSLMMAGGGALSDEIIERFIELAGGPDAPLVFVPCAQEDEIRQIPGTVRLLRRAGAKKVTWIHTKDRDAASTSAEILEPLRKAKGIWFGGGRQWNLVDSYQNTKAHELMHGVLERGGVIAGSSAGASIQGSYLARGDPLGNLNIIAEGYERGLGFLTGVAIDQHFSQRARHADMSKLVSVYPQLLGIGLDEGTALVVSGTAGEVLGPAGQAVYFFDTKKTAPTVPGQDYLTVRPGQRFDLKERLRLQ